MQERIRVLRLLKDDLYLAQQRMKLYADKRRIEREFDIGDEVFLKLQPYRQTSISLKKQLKPSAKYFGPYKVIERIRKVAYGMHLLHKSKMHPMFRVSLLKKKIDLKHFPSMNLPKLEDVIYKNFLVPILDRGLIPKKNVVVP
ncbi:UNVERIFIED_CONTAM: hypothetical protein Scaly_0484400 [Sesamum calycinum]|uniref:Tf2-1-like SH3-like domain-containing protein n=1 Tax=Sesamum calycinum TaxID=2727403 RepID=A0AAW2RRB9_9LAMI